MALCNPWVNSSHSLRSTNRLSKRLSRRFRIIYRSSCRRNRRTRWLCVPSATSLYRRGLCCCAPIATGIPSVFDVADVISRSLIDASPRMISSYAKTIISSEKEFYFNPQSSSVALKQQSFEHKN